jgi:hypothetical protein
MHLVPPALVELDSARAGDAGGAVGGLAVLRARLALAGHAQSQHVHADRDGHRRRLCSTAWSATLAPQWFPPRVRATCTARSRSISRRPRSSPCWCCSGQVLELRARERTSGAIRALLDLAPKTARRVDRAARRGCRDRCDRGRRSGCGCGPARRSRSTASVTEGRSALSTSRW